MKNLLYVMLCVALLASCGGKKEMPKKFTVSGFEEGEKRPAEEREMSGIEDGKTLNDDGTKIIEVPFRWFAGIGKADNKQMAIELAQREAYAGISRVLSNAVSDGAKRGNVANNGKVQQALTSYWEQVSVSIQKACEPFGKAHIEYSPTSGMYEVVAKVGVRGDRFQKMLNAAGNYRPDDLNKEELEQFIEANKSIMEAARGN